MPPILNSLSKLSFVGLSLFALVQCGKLNQYVPEAELKDLGTDGVISRYHALLNTPHSHPLSANGYIIGIEKAPRERIGANFKAHDNGLIEFPAYAANTYLQRNIDQQKKTFEAATNDPKVMFVSHILQYDANRVDGAILTTPLYSAYYKTAFGGHAPVAPEDAYAKGMSELRALEEQILVDIAAATKRGEPYTHIMLLSMGWNNDQFESLERYNAIFQTSVRAAQSEGTKFKPLIIGLTWPSVWGGTSVLDVANRAFHIGSYPVKARDSDEIGYGIVNYLFNDLLPRVENHTDLKTVAIGHSMGARILSRAYYSADYLKQRGPAREHPPLLIGLQGAFSINRFREGHQLIPPVRWLFNGEGGPHQDHAAPGGKLVLTWAERDFANPVARFATGAAHVGGSVADRRLSRNPALQEKVTRHTLKADSLEELAKYCQAGEGEDDILYLNASQIIAAHGDIRNPDVGRLVWNLVDCYE